MTRVATCLVLACVVLGSTAARAQDSAEPDLKKDARKAEGTAGSRFRSDADDVIAWGINVALVRVAATRPSNEPARLRNYAMNAELLPKEFGFFVELQPHGVPWTFNNKSGSVLHLMAPVFFLLVGPNAPFAQGSVSLGGGLSFLDRYFMLGFEFDLYRGIPTLGVDNRAGSATAQTGVLAWAWSRQGEVTAENIAFVLSFNLGKVTKLLESDSQGQ